MWAAVAVLTVATSVHAQGGAPGASSRLQGVDDESPDTIRGSAGRLMVHINGAYQATARLYERPTAFQVYGEEAQFLTREEFRGQTHIDAGAAVRIWRWIEVGASYTQVSRSGTAVVSGIVPHPLDVGRDRIAPTQTFTLPHRQRATHAYALWRFGLRSAWSMALSAGPTYFNLRQGGVATLTPGETGGPPFSEVSLHVGTAEHTRNGVGFNAGADFAVMLPRWGAMPRLGVGYFVRLTLGSVVVPSIVDPEDTYYVGGVQTGVGLRVRF